MDIEFFRTPRGLLALAALIVGSALYTGPSMQSLLAEVPWEYMPESVAQAAVAHYDATFIPAAAAYLSVMNDVVEMQVDAYKTVGVGAAAAIEALADTKPVAAAAEWYVNTEQHVETRLSPQ